MNKMSLRRRILLAFGLLICCTLIALATALLLSTAEREEELIDEIVNATMHQIEARWPTQDELLLPPSLSFYHAPIGQKPVHLPAEIAGFSLGNSEYIKHGREYHVGVREYRGERLYLLYDTQLHEERLFEIYLGVTFAVIFLASLSLAAGYFFAGSILQQFSALTEAVEQDLPIVVGELRDQELVVLAQAITESREQKAQLLQRERDFTAHVGHELRTPLTRIRSGAELLREIGQLNPTDLKRVAQIEIAADEMEQRLSALLFLARDVKSLNILPLNLHQAVAESLSHFDAVRTEIVRVNRIDTTVQIHSDPRLLKMLIDNLLSNALRYTQAGQIEFSWHDGAFYLSDTGPGIAAEDLSRLVLPFERASDLPDGMGLGLAIVNRICEAMHWRLHIGSQLGCGTQVCVHMADDTARLT